MCCKTCAHIPPSPANTHTGIPNPEQPRWEEEHASHLGVKVRGGSVCSGDPDATFPGMRAPIVTALAWGAHCLAPTAGWGTLPNPGHLEVSPSTGFRGALFLGRFSAETQTGTKMYSFGKRAKLVPFTPDAESFSGSCPADYLHRKTGVPFRAGNLRVCFLEKLL